MLTVIGCGNLMRRDDGVGVVVVRRLATHLQALPIPGVQACDCGTAGLATLYHARGSQALCIIDASQSGAQPGTIHELPGEALERAAPPPCNLHELRWEHALALGRALYTRDFPREVNVILVEAAELGHGEGLSARVAQAADQVFERLLQRCASYAAAHITPGGRL